MPVPLRNQRPEMHQLAGFVRCAFAAVGPYDMDLRVGNRAADGIGVAVDQPGIEIGRSECLGQAIMKPRPPVTSIFILLFYKVDDQFSDESYLLIIQLGMHGQ